MGTLANSVFQLALGWIRALSVEIWNTASAPEGTTLIGWIGDHWLPVAAILCGAGLVIDLTVYLFRWQPYRVWASFFRRMRRGGEEEEAPDAEEEKYAYSGRKYGRQEEESAGAIPSRKSYDGSGISRGRSLREDWEEERNSEPEEDDPEEEYGEEAYEGPKRGLSWHRTEPEGTTAAFEQAIRPVRRRRVTRLFSEKGEEDTASPDELIDRYAAYRRPVYPRNWKRNDAGETVREDR